ncbi:surA N-terminal domain protein [Clostridioides difficile CD160]|nr:surA N-terminal domain protein [Clostridioides difficile CD160]
MKNKLTKRKITFFVSLLCFGFLCFFLGIEKGTTHINHLREYKPKEVIATINGQSILGEDLEKHLDIYSLSIPISDRENLTNDNIDVIESESLNSMILSKSLLDTINKEKEITVTDEELNSHYDKILKNMLDSTNMNKKEFFKCYDLKETYLKKLFKEDLLVSKYLSNKSSVSNEELNQYFNKNKSNYKEIRVSKILIKDITDSGNKKATEIISKLKNGDKFEDLYNKYDDTKSTTNSTNGDLGYLSKNDLQDELKKALFSEDLNVGEVYPAPIKTASGYFIIKKTDEKNPRLEEIKKDIESDIKYEKQKKEISNSLKKSTIDIKLKLNIPIKNFS